MAELFAISKTKKLMRFAGEFALKISQRLLYDVLNKDVEGYVLSDCYDMVQNSVFLFIGLVGGGIYLAIVKKQIRRKSNIKIIENY